MAFLYRPTVTRQGPDGRKRCEKSRFWWGKYPDPVTGKAVPVAFKTEDRQVAHKLLLLAEREAATHAGDAFREHRLTPLIDHVEAWRASLAAKGDTAAHVKQTVARGLAVIDGCAFHFPPDIRAERVEDWLAIFRADTLDAAGGVLKRGAGAQTRNYYLAAFKAFCGWLVRYGRMAANPVGHVGAVNARIDRRERRVLAADECRRLIDTTRESTEVRDGLTGQARAVLYELALTTGVRRNEAKRLTWGCIDGDSDPPTLTIPAGYSKHRREDRLPLKPSVAQSLARWQAQQGNPGTDTPVFAAWWKCDRASETLHADLSDARAAWIGAARTEAERQTREAGDFLKADADGRSVDFHALRHTFISALVRGGVHPKLAQTLARHSTITLTMDRYAHTVIGEQADALTALPDLYAMPADEREAVATVKTGTNSVALPVASRKGNVRVEMSRNVQAGGMRRLAPKPLKTRDFSAKTASRPAGLEPATAGLEIRCVDENTRASAESVDSSGNANSVASPVAPEIAELAHKLAALTPEQRAALAALLGVAL